MTKQQQSKSGLRKKRVELKTLMKKKSAAASKTQKQPQGKTKLKGSAQLKKTVSQSKGKSKTVLAKMSNVKKVANTTKSPLSKKVNVNRTTKPKTPTKVEPVVKVKAATKTTSTKPTKILKNVKKSSKSKERSESIKQALKLIKEASKNSSKRKSTVNKKTVSPSKNSKMAKQTAAKHMPVKSVTLKRATPSQQMQKKETKGKTPKKVVKIETAVKPKKGIKAKPKVITKPKDKEKVSDKSQLKTIKQKANISKTEVNKGHIVKKTTEVKHQKETKTTENSDEDKIGQKRKAESSADKKDIPAKKKSSEIKPKPKKSTTLKATLAKRQIAKETAKLVQTSPRQRKPKVFHDFLVFTDKGVPDKKLMDSEKKTQSEQRKRKEKSPPNKNVPAKKVKKSDEKPEVVIKKTSKPNSDDKENKQTKGQQKTVQHKKAEKSGDREKLTKVKNKENKKAERPKNKKTGDKKTATPRKNSKNTKKVIEDQEVDPDELKMKAILACERKVQWQDDRSPCWITGIAALATGQTVLADMSNKKIKLLDLEYNVVTVQSLPSCPQAIATSPHEKNSAYFTMPFEKCGIQKITATKGDCLEITEKISTIGTTRGITCTKECIIVSVDDRIAGPGYEEGFRIDIMNYKGKVLKSIQNSDLLKLPLYLAASNSTDIIISNCRKGSPSIVKIDQQGTIDYKYEGESSSKLSIEPRGITVDEDHNVYVSEWRSNYVYILSPAGKRTKILLRGEDIMTVGSFFSRPYQLCYSKFEGKPRKLIVSFESWDRIKIFNIVKFQQC